MVVVHLEVDLTFAQALVPSLYEGLLALAEPLNDHYIHFLPSEVDLVVDSFEID